MPRVIDLIRQSLESRVWPPRVPPLEELRRTEWSEEFETLMRNRLLMGAFRYGLMDEKALKLGKWQMVASMRKRLDLYEQDRNLEHLVDVANICLVEYVAAKAAGFRLTAIDDGHHVAESA